LGLLEAALASALSILDVLSWRLFEATARRRKIGMKYLQALAVHYLAHQETLRFPHLLLGSYFFVKKVHSIEDLQQQKNGDSRSQSKCMMHKAANSTGESPWEFVRLFVCETIVKIDQLMMTFCLPGGAATSVVRVVMQARLKDIAKFIQSKNSTPY
jgi:hypothetical protein